MPLPQTQVTCLQRRENADFKRGRRGGGSRCTQIFPDFANRCVCKALSSAWADDCSAEEVLRRSTNELLLMRFRQKL